jgi:hypothetical protein
MYNISRRYAASAVAVAAAIGFTALSLSTPAYAAGRSADAASVSVVASPAATLPNSDIKGSATKPHFAPASLTATAAWPSGSTSCVAAQASFTITNDTKASQTITLKATGIKGSDTFTMAKKTLEYICITTGYTGVMHAKDSASGKSLKVTF